MPTTTGGGSAAPKRKPKPRSKTYDVYVAPKNRGKTGVKGAAKKLNKQLGSKVVRTTKKKRAADAVVKFGRTRPSAAAVTQRGLLDVITLSGTFKDVGPQAWRHTTEHELGHGLGLGHNKGDENLMNPRAIGQKLKPAQRKKVRRRRRAGAFAARPTRPRDARGRFR